MCCPNDVFDRGYAVMIFIVFVVVAVFLGIGRTSYGSGSKALGLFSINARGSAVSPGPGDADAVVTGTLRIDRNQKMFQWKLVYDKVDGVIIWMRVSGPVGATTTTTGPVVIWLCGGDADKTCDLRKPNLLEGKIGEDSHGSLSPRTPITQIAEDGANFYYLEIGTSSFPNGAVRQQLCCTTGPGAW